MPRCDYEKIREIGSGSYGKAFLVESAGSKKLRVMKEIDFSNQDAQRRANAAMEAKVLSSLKHPYIVRYIESFMTDRHLCIVMDYCEGGDLWLYIAGCRKKRTQIPENQVVRWFTQMCLALKYMHQRSVLHRDIKTQNVFLTRGEGAAPNSLGCARIADFGISKVLGEGSSAFARTVVGTPYYLSPEICLKHPYACPSDVWALGCVLYELCARRVPFEAKDLPQLLECIVRGPHPQLPPMYSREVGDLFSALLVRDATRRPTAAAILQRPLLQEEIKRMIRDNHQERDGLPNEEAVKGTASHGCDSARCDSARYDSARCDSARFDSTSCDRNIVCASARCESSVHSHRRPLGERNEQEPIQRGERKPNFDMYVVQEKLRSFAAASPRCR
jgi:NIMA (never in mitosis gene a)-related kinase